MFEGFTYAANAAAHGLGTIQQKIQCDKINEDNMTAHERALERAYDKHIEKISYGVTRDLCKAYLQALLDDTETATEFANAIYSNFYSDADEFINAKDLDNKIWGEGWSKNDFIKAAKAAISTLKRMAGV